jgi:hypothetical protein
LDPAIDAKFPGLTDGALSLTNTRKMELPHYTTAQLVKSASNGIGITGTLRADGEITQYRFQDGRVLWSFRVDGFEFELGNAAAKLPA